MIAKYLRDDYKRKDIYYAVYSLLRAIGTFRKIKEKNFNIEAYIESCIRICVEQIIKEIVDNLDFSQISEMVNLITIIKGDKLYQQLLINVSEYDCSKNTKGYRIFEKPKRYSFGNREYAEDLDIVDIDAYEDCVILTYRKEGRNFESSLNKNSWNNKISFESKILSALDNWRCHYTN